MSLFPSKHNWLHVLPGLQRRSLSQGHPCALLRQLCGEVPQQPLSTSQVIIHTDQVQWKTRVLQTCLRAANWLAPSWDTSMLAARNREETHPSHSYSADGSPATCPHGLAVGKHRVHLHHQMLSLLLVLHFSWQPHSRLVSPYRRLFVEWDKGLLQNQSFLKHGHEPCNATYQGLLCVCRHPPKGDAFCKADPGSDSFPWDSQDLLACSGLQWMRLVLCTFFRRKRDNERSANCRTMSTARTLAAFLLHSIHRAVFCKLGIFKEYNILEVFSRISIYKESLASNNWTRQNSATMPTAEFTQFESVSQLHWKNSITTGTAKDSWSYRWQHINTVHILQ